MLLASIQEISNERKYSSISMHARALLLLLSFPGITTFVPFIIDEFLVFGREDAYGCFGAMHFSLARVGETAFGGMIRPDLLPNAIESCPP